MRELKFRAWDTEKKEMIYDGMCDKCDGWYGSENTYLHIHFDGSISGQISDDGGKNGLHEHDADIKKDRLILMQFTGLLDRHNVPIYEGDILKLVSYQNVGKHSVRTVTFDRGCFGFIDATGKFFPLGIVIGNKGNEKIFEVIGNIYDKEEP